MWTSQEQRTIPCTEVNETFITQSSQTVFARNHDMLSVTGLYAKVFGFVEPLTQTLLQPQHFLCPSH